MKTRNRYINVDFTEMNISIEGRGYVAIVENITLVRAVRKGGGFYDIKNKEFKEVERIVFMNLGIPYDENN